MTEKKIQQEIDLKMAELKRVLPFLVIAPYLKILFLAGSIAEGRPKKESDLDLIIVARHNRIWLNRFFLEIITRIFGIRRTPQKISNKICFNICLSAAAPLLPHQDLVAANFYKNIKPIWGDDINAVEKFWAKNLWIKNFCELPPTSRQLIFETNYKFINLTRKTLEKILDLSVLGFILEKITFYLQKKYLENKFKKNNSGALAEFQVKPNLIYYHFPISNHARSAQNMAQMADVSRPIDPPDQKLSQLD